MSSDSSPLRLGVNGASGRMGQRVVALALKDPNFQVISALEASESKAMGKDAGLVAGCDESGVLISDQFGDAIDVVIDFSTPAGFSSIVRRCGDQSIPLVAATTGLDDAQRESIRELSEKVPVVFAPSMSLSVNIAMKLATEAARAMKEIPGGVDVEIIERHHRYKEDAPSGTALHFGKLIANEMGQTEHVHGRSGQVGQRPQSEIGYHALRTGDNVGEHTIIFGILGETLEIQVKSHTRDAYALGALAAARFVVGQSAGLYGMADVLGL